MSSATIESTAQYLGFCIDAHRDIFKVYGATSSSQPTKLVASSKEALTLIEQQALEKDKGPTLYHWNNLIIKNDQGKLSEIYARGKDFIPLSPLDYWEHLKKIAKNAHVGPLSMQIQPNQVCNDTCIFCCTEGYRAKPIYKKQRFTYEEWEEILTFFAHRGGRVVEIIGGGEPTLLPYFNQILKLIGNLNLKAYLFTNGYHFSTHNGQLNTPFLDLIAEHCALLNVSLDGYHNRDKVHCSRTAKKTEETFKGLEYIASIRDPHQMGFYHSYIITGAPGQYCNIEDLAPCVERLSALGDSMHIQNDFVQMSHEYIDAEYGHQIIQPIIDQYFHKIYLYFNAPLIKKFHLKLPYENSIHHVPSSSFKKCMRSRVSPTFECGSNKLWPCGLYAGAATPEDKQPFSNMKMQFDELYQSSDYKQGMYCDPCINSSLNHTLELLNDFSHTQDTTCYLFYPKDYVERTMQGGV
jgi:sulfatase maturation enzyme AslB (radical SAM superfamily)